MHCALRCCAGCFRSPWLYLTLVYLSLAAGLTVISYRNYKLYQQPFSKARCSIPHRANQSDIAGPDKQICETTSGKDEDKLLVNVTLEGDKYTTTPLLFDNGTKVPCVSDDVLANLTSATADDDDDDQTFDCWFHKRSKYALLRPGSFIRNEPVAAKNILITSVILASSCLIFLLLPIWRFFRHNHHHTHHRNTPSRNHRHDPMTFPSVLHHLSPPMYVIVVTERMATSVGSPQSRHLRALSQREANAVIGQLRARYKERGGSSQLGADVNVCAICLEELDESNKGDKGDGDGGGLVCFPCNHVFHAVCAEQWLRKGAPKCPYCMEVLKLERTCASGDGVIGQCGGDDIRVVVVDDDDDGDDNHVVESVDNR